MGMDGYEEESGGNKRLFIGIGIGAVVLVVVIVTVVIIIRRRADDGAVADGGTPSAPVSAPASPPGPPLPPLPPPSDYSATTIGGDTPGAQATPASSSNGLTAGMVRDLTDDEKKQHGYPLSWTVQIRARQREGSSELFAEYVIISKGDQPADQDEDGLSDEKEQELGTDPARIDTDGDRLSDRDEVEDLKTDPLRVDSDGDRVNDGDEVEQKRDPLAAGT